MTDEPLKVVIASNSFDIGGQGVRIAQAFARHAPDWVVRSMSKVGSYLAYPTDLPYRRRELEELYQACDVFHARLDFTDYDRLAAKFGSKPVILHAHGTKYRADPNHWAREAAKRNALIVVSTLDLWLLNTDATWLPAPYDVDWLQAMR
jgi:hypothetical protein